jgi:hypothetical protein
VWEEMDGLQALIAKALPAIPEPPARPTPQRRQMVGEDEAARLPSDKSPHSRSPDRPPPGPAPRAETPHPIAAAGEQPLPARTDIGREREAPANESALREAAPAAAAAQPAAKDGDLREAAPAAPIPADIPPPEAAEEAPTPFDLDDWLSNVTELGPEDAGPGNGS